MKSKIQAMYWMIKFGICDLLSREERKDIDDLSTILKEAQYLVYRDTLKSFTLNEDKHKELMRVICEDQIEFWKSKAEELQDVQ